MKRMAPLLIAAWLVGPPAAAEPVWSQISFVASPSDTSKVAAAADRFMSSEIGKTFPGKLLLQVVTANGSQPATHTFVPIYKTPGEREAFVQSLQGNPAWSSFQSTMEDLTQPGGTVLYRTLDSWGDINDKDPVWVAHAFDVSDPSGFVAAVDEFMKSPTGKKFPGQVYVSSVVAGGMKAPTHLITVGYGSESEMFSWLDVRNGSDDWAAYQKSSAPAAEYMGTTMARDLKTWGPATLQDIVAP